ncbi:hypothetical protein DSL92_05310 [Billgrantia gudaonensis]|uniref:GGDEF domain-containing protein n=1 Tax=Billgrantia gudaonensis TaxID=376427 RepID=A0A432JJ03_9GAMM|nr:hypothetical protein DSL92_05310 [Halomonas gudaonensis]
MTISIGLANLQVDDSARDLLQRADRALSAKHKGRNRVEWLGGSVVAGRDPRSFRSWRRR